MSTAAQRSVPPTPTTPTAAKSKKAKKKKKAAGKANEGTENARKDGEEHEEHGDDNEEEEREEEAETAPSDGKGEEAIVKGSSLPSRSRSATNGDLAAAQAMSKDDSAAAAVSDTTSNGDTQARLDALLQEREALRQEVTELRKSLEDIRSKHTEEVESLKEQVESERGEKEEAQEEYQTLVGRVNTLRAQLQDRLKADEEELAEARGEIEELQSKNAALTETANAQKAELEKLTEESEEQAKELSTMRNRANLSTQNWNEERDDLVRKEAYAREEFEQAKQAMQDWEILAVEERSQKQTLSEKVNELQDELQAERDEHERAKRDRDTQANAVEGLQKGLQDIQDARKVERRDLVEGYEKQLNDLRKQIEDAQAAEKSSLDRLKGAEEENRRLQPLEGELKEKSLLIGKLRHNAVTLNDHLKKALKQLQSGRTEDTIDRQLVTNHMLQFLSLNQGDPKKFQILQIMAAMLNWTDEQRESAGLSRPGTSNPNLRSPISPWHRTPSTPSLSTANLSVASGEPARKESIANLFSEFLETESQGGSSKATSISGISKPA